MRAITPNSRLTVPQRCDRTAPRGCETPLRPFQDCFSPFCRGRSRHLPSPEVNVSACAPSGANRLAQCRSLERGARLRPQAPIDRRRRPSRATAIGDAQCPPYAKRVEPYLADLERPRSATTLVWRIWMVGIRVAVADAHTGRYLSRGRGDDAVTTQRLLRRPLCSAEHWREREHRPR